MKINEKMKFPYPVLSKNSSDYKDGEFSASFTQQLTDDEQIKITSEFVLKCSDIQRLIHEQKACCGYFIVCGPTYYNNLLKAGVGETDNYINISDLFGTVILQPVIWTINPLIDFSSSYFDTEFGREMDISKGSIIAIGPEFKFSLDPKKFKPFETIFKIDQHDSIKPGMISVDPDQDKISILAEPKTFKSIVSMRNTKKGRDILLNTVYMPAIMDVISRLQIGDSNLENHPWYRVFKAKCDDLAINPSDNSDSALLMTQKLLQGPLGRTISIMESG